MRNEYHQKVDRNIAKHDAWDLTQTVSLTPELDDIDNDGGNCDDIFETRDGFRYVSSGQKAYQRQAQLLST